MILSRDDYVEIIKSSFVTFGVKILMAEAVSAVPFLAWPFFNPITKMAVEWAVTKLVTSGETAAFFLFIDMRVGKQAKGFEQAAIENAVAQLKGTAEEKKNAEQNLKIAFRDFIRITT